MSDAPAPAHYTAVRFDAPAAEAEAWSDALLDAGALSVDVSDPFAGTPDEAPIYGEPGMAATETWATSRVVALFAADADWRAALDRVANELALPAPLVETYPVAEQDWVRQTQSQFGPIEIAPGFWIVPSWSAAPAPATLVLRLDPGLAFGTGSHPTTRMCLQWLQAHVARGDALLDYGCGSGILAIAAAKLGAGRVVGVDIDPQSLRAAGDNARANAADVAIAAPDDLPEGTFDVVVANILTNPLIVLAPAIATRVRAGGRLALTGILEEQAQSVVAAYAPWFTLAPWRVCDGWVLLTGCRDR